MCLSHSVSMGLLPSSHNSSLKRGHSCLPTLENGACCHSLSHTDPRDVSGGWGGASELLPVPNVSHGICSHPFLTVLGRHTAQSRVLTTFSAGCNPLYSTSLQIQSLSLRKVEGKCLHRAVCSSLDYCLWLFSLLFPLPQSIHGWWIGDSSLWTCSVRLLGHTGCSSVCAEGFPCSWQGFLPGLLLSVKGWRQWGGRWLWVEWGLMRRLF